MISSQEEYDKELKIFNDKIKSYSPIKMMRQPYNSFNEVMQLFNHAEEIGLFPSEYCQEQRTKLLEGINNQNLKEKVKDYLIKKGVIKK